MNILKYIKIFFKHLSEIARIQQEMETGRIACLKCNKRKVDMIYKGIELVGLCRNCGNKN